MANEPALKSNKLILFEIKRMQSQEIELSAVYA